MKSRIVLDYADYYEAIGFAVYSFVASKISKFSSLQGGKRALGDYIESFLFGKLAELAFRKFIRENFDIDVLTDIDINGFIEGIYLPDIVAISNGGSYVPPSFWTEIKEMRRSQKWLLVPDTERLYDAYVAVYVDAPEEHLLHFITNYDYAEERLSKDFRKISKEISLRVVSITCDVVGFVLWDDVNLVLSARQGDKNAMKELDRKFGEGRWNYFKEGEHLYDPDTLNRKGEYAKGIRLRRSNIGFFASSLRSDWEVFMELLKTGKRLVPPISKSNYGKKITRRGLPKRYYSLWDEIDDYREVFLNVLHNELNRIEEAFGGMPREMSWFSMPFHHE